jgi:ankyrin repeat protein
MNAAYNKKNDLVEYLITQGADVNAKEPSGWTALMFAEMVGEVESVKFLIEAGADLNSKTNKDETALQRVEKIQEAKLGDVAEVIKILKKAGGK